MAAGLTPPEPPLTDGVIVLRPFRFEDADAIVEACQDPEVVRWIPLIPVPYAGDDARRFILGALQSWKDGTGYEFAIAEAATGLYLGSIGVHLGANPRRHTIGYLVAPRARGRGVATSALRLASRWAFDNLAVERLSLWTLPGNVASQAVAEKAGYRYEGLMRNWDVGRDGRPIDAVMFSITPEDLDEPSARRAAAHGPLPIAAFPSELRAEGTRAAPFLGVLPARSLEPGSMRRLTVAGLDLLVAWTAVGIAVTDDRCPHMSAPLSVGTLEGCVVACPLHEGRFDLCTGEAVQMPTTGGLDADGGYHRPWSPSGAEPRTEPSSSKAEARRLTRVRRLRYYPVRVREGKLEIQLPILPA
jgi:RimJ/RimL family protein N-acetyltransferase/nitrite reductase/ring-hydroxylating ferredoxin subunit